MSTPTPHKRCAQLRSAVASALMGLLLTLGSVAEAIAQAKPVARVFAAASLTNAFDQVALAWRQLGNPAPVLVYGASSALAKQIDAGAPADIYASADTSWMDYLAQRGRLRAGSRFNLLGNTLVLIAPAGSAVPVQMQRGFKLAAAFDGKLCIAEPGVVPAGIYAQQSLQHFAWWQPLQGRIVGTDDVRTALTFVERGECALGIVYATDARVSRKVQIVAHFPQASHQPIVYPFALTAEASVQAAELFAFLNSKAARSIFTQHGFGLVAP